MTTRRSNSEWERKQRSFPASSLAGAVSFLVLLTLCLNAASATTIDVMIGSGGNNFSPSSVTIQTGDRVRWTWAASGHSTTSGTPGAPNGLWDSGIRNQGATFTHEFNSVGTFPYFCTPHGECCGMTGIVNVTGGTPTPSPSPTATATVTPAPTPTVTPAPTATATPAPTATPGPTAIPTPVPLGTPPTDFNRDSKPDYLLYNPSTRRTAVWFLNNNLFIGGAFGLILPVGLNVIDAADINRDTRPDYVLFHPSTRRTAIWYLAGVKGVTFIGSAWGPILPAGWALVATGDFNNDARPDFVIFNATTRQTAVWYLNNNMFIGGAFAPSIPSPWILVGIADFNRDGKSDYLLFNPSTRTSVSWYLSGTTRIASAFGPTIAAGYNLSGTADFNRDGRPDYLLFNPSTRQTAIWYLNNNVRIGTAVGPTLATGFTLAAP